MSFSRITVNKARTGVTVPTGTPYSGIVAAIRKRLSLDEYTEISIVFNGVVVYRGDELKDGDHVIVNGPDGWPIGEPHPSAFGVDAVAVASPRSWSSENGPRTPVNANTAVAWLRVVSAQPNNLDALIAATGLTPLDADTDVKLPASWTDADERALATNFLRQLGVVFPTMLRVLSAPQYSAALLSVSKICQSATKALVNKANVARMRDAALTAVPVFTAAHVAGSTQGSASGARKALSAFSLNASRFENSEFLRRDLTTEECNTRIERLHGMLVESLKSVANKLPAPHAHDTHQVLAAMELDYEVVPALDAAVEAFKSDRSTLMFKGSLEEAQAFLRGSDANVVVREVGSDFPPPAPVGLAVGIHYQVVVQQGEEFSTFGATNRELDDNYVLHYEFSKAESGKAQVTQPPVGAFSGVRCKVYDVLDGLLGDVEELTGVYTTDEQYIERASA